MEVLLFDNAMERQRMRPRATTGSLPRTMPWDSRGSRRCGEAGRSAVWAAVTHIARISTVTIVNYYLLLFIITNH